ncbi:hypothetical protein K445DRAFT_313137 [Daldinia sp. EC12]|nr:hypothetical protein K445DRAFT_313137 [Daldinia sp. EC12]
MSILSPDNDDDSIRTRDGKRDIFSLKRSRIPSPVLIQHEPPLKRPATGPNGVSLRNGQIPRVTRKKDPKPNPREWYGSPPPPPESWGPKDKNGRRLFKYTECGELERGKTYTAHEMRRYLYGPKNDDTFPPPTRLAGVPEVKDRIRQGLTLWIGWVAPQSNDRYPFSTQSQKCRFADCDDSQNTIRTGFPRIIIDERMNDDGEVIDPYHNAGYMHLYCFEKHFDLVDAFIHLDVRPDERNFKHEDNLFKLTRQYPEMRAIVDQWWQEEYPKFIEARSQGKRRDHSTYKNSLGTRLVSYAIDNSSDARLKLREERGGANVSKHKGDLAKQKFLRQCRCFGLLDENDDPIPGAHELLPELIIKKRQAKKLARNTGRRDTSSPLGSPITPTAMEFQNAVEVQQGTPSVKPGNSQISTLPFRIPSPVDHNSPVPQGSPLLPVSPITSNYNQSTPPSPSGQLPLPSPIISSPASPRSVSIAGNKRDRDEVLAEDQNIGIPSEPDQGSPEKKLRTSPTSSPQAVYAHTPDSMGQRSDASNLFDSVTVATESNYFTAPSSPSAELVSSDPNSDFNVNSTDTIGAIVKGSSGDSHHDEMTINVASVEALVGDDKERSEVDDDLFGGPADAPGLADLVNP